MLAKFYTKMCDLYPRFRKISRKQMYQLMAYGYQKQDWTFMNYGYATESAAARVVLHEDDEINRYCIQLYHYVASAIQLRGLDLLEVGSGRGGGADYIKRYLDPACVVGVDYSDNAVNLCRQHFSVEGLSFVPGDAENLPFNDQSFDIVLNVESSHCYGSMSDFLAQVKRVLKPGGYFMFADFRNLEQLDELEEQLERTGMRCITKENITPNVIKALDADHGRRFAHIQRGVPKTLHKLLQEFAGNKDTWIYKGFQTGDIVYQNFLYQKV
ncbi:MAG TPA: class I SAM-dependent methyltransferase [Negativicutes bacterium]|nr:class I SAM-dependent methyltransferase [Negativicutes bacterium]